MRDRAPGPLFMMLGQTHVNVWSRVIASQNGGSTDYIFPLRLGVLQWSRHSFNYWKNKKTIIKTKLSQCLIKHQVLNLTKPYLRILNLKPQIKNYNLA